MDDVGVGDIWFFPSGLPHSIQGLGPDGCEFLLIFDDGDFDEDNTFMIADWFKHVPNEVLAKNFAAPASAFARTPEESQRYIFPVALPGPLHSDYIAGATPTPQIYTSHMMAQEPIKTKSGTVRITDTGVFPASKTISAALVDLLTDDAAHAQAVAMGRARLATYSWTRSATIVLRALEAAAG